MTFQAGVILFAAVCFLLAFLFPKHPQGISSLLTAALAAPTVHTATALSPPAMQFNNFLLRQDLGH